MKINPPWNKLKNVECMMYLRGGGGGVQAYHFGKKFFELGVGGEGQDGRTRPIILRVVLGPYCAILPM